MGNYLSRFFICLEFAKQHVTCCNGLGYELEPHQFRQRLVDLKVDMQGQMKTTLQEWFGSKSLGNGLKVSMTVRDMVI